MWWQARPDPQNGSTNPQLPPGAYFLIRFLPEICLLIHTWNNQGTTVLSTRHTHTPTCSLVALQVCNSHSAHHLATKNRSSGPAFCGTVKVANVISVSQRYTWHHCAKLLLFHTRFVWMINILFSILAVLIMLWQWVTFLQAPRQLTLLIRQVDGIFTLVFSRDALAPVVGVMLTMINDLQPTVRKPVGFINLTVRSTGQLNGLLRGCVRPHHLG
jgi:hypothetical protein